jgi:hypothetical protein
MLLRKGERQPIGGYDNCFRAGGSWRRDDGIGVDTTLLLAWTRDVKLL